MSYLLTRCYQFSPLCIELKFFDVKYSIFLTFLQSLVIPYWPSKQTSQKMQYRFILLQGNNSNEKQLNTQISSHNHHFKWWFGMALIRASYTHAQKGGYRKHRYWSAYKAVLLESSFLDSSACSLMYFLIASSVILPMVDT